MRQLLDGALGCWTNRPAAGGRELSVPRSSWVDLHAAYLRAGATLLRTATFDVTHRLGRGGSEEEARVLLAAALGAITEAEARTKSEAASHLLSIGPTGLPASAARDARAVYRRLAAILAELRLERRSSGRSLTLLLESFRAWGEVELALECFGVDDTWLLVAPRADGGLAELDLRTAAERAEGQVRLLGLGCHDEGLDLASALRALEERFGGPLALSLPAFGNGADWAASSSRLAAEVSRVHAIGGCCGTGPGHIAALREAAAISAVGTPA